jgi:hypothetical protein
MKTIKRGVIALAAILMSGLAFGATNLNFNAVSATSEGAIRLSWNSTTNEVYEIDYADQVVDVSAGGTSWQPLYTEYPSHGTNTFITDAGNYDLAPEIPHPTLSPMRFYRIALVGTNTSATNPTVSITFPTNGASLSGDVTVVVSSSSPEFLTEVRLYVDGEEQWMADDGTNFLINTCEWANGPHTLFATAKAQSAIEGFPYNYAVTFGRSVSSYVNVTFNNLITSFDLSERFFEPALGQTQKVTATFTANVNWILEIQNAATNDVRYVTGSGGTMEFDWDGTGTNGAAIADGAYSYLLSVQTNGLPLPNHSSGGGSTNLPPSPGAAFASPSGSMPDSNIIEIQYPPLPPGLFYGLDDNGNSITNRTAIIQLPIAPLGSALTTSADSSSLAAVSSGFAAASFGSSTQNTRAPKRKPRVGLKNKTGTFGVCYKTYPAGFFMQQPRTRKIPPLQPFTGVDGGSPNANYISWSSLTTEKASVNVFAKAMQLGNYKAAFIKADEQWGPLDIEKPSLGGNSIFNTCNFGLLTTHGCYGTNPEIDGVKYTYLALFDQKNASSYVRLSDMDFGSSGTSGLKWMTILSCNMLYSNNVTSMINNTKMPDNGNLHLLLGFDSLSYSAPRLGLLYASNLVNSVSIPNSLIDASTKTYAAAYPKNRGSMTNTVIVRIMGYNSCIGDTLYQSSDPDPNTTYQIIDQPVFSPSP